MLLALDVGNTNIVLGVYDGRHMAYHARLATDHARTDDEYGVLIQALLSDAGIERGAITHAIIASVVPPLTTVFERVCTKRYGVTPLVVGPGIRTGMPVRYDNPKEVGADRIVNGVAGYARYHDAPGGPHGVIVVDFGTATTFDVISPKGEYLGGAIAPGIGISMEALFRHASKLPRVDLSTPPTAIGKSTVVSMQAGIMFGYVGLVDGIVERMRKELPFEPKVIATGGLAPVIGEQTVSIHDVDDFLTLWGLLLIYERNRAESA